jgi:hypothetical protein
MIGRIIIPGKGGIFKFYLLLVLFCALIALLVISGESEGAMVFLNDAIENPVDLFFDDLSNTFFWVGLSLIFPASIYTAFLSARSLILSHKLNRSCFFGIVLLITSLSSLVLSFFSFFIILTFWIQGGIKF